MLVRLGLAEKIEKKARQQRKQLKNRKLRVHARQAGLGREDREEGQAAEEAAQKQEAPRPWNQEGQDRCRQEVSALPNTHGPTTGLSRMQGGFFTKIFWTICA